MRRGALAERTALRRRIIGHRRSHGLRGSPSSNNVGASQVPDPSAPRTAAAERLEDRDAEWTVPESDVITEVPERARPAAV
jgi:hypothetical protein